MKPFIMVGPVMQASTRIDWHDRLGTIKARLGINRMNYKVAPGIYAIGHPEEHSPVLVTANYKLTFDTVRKALAGMNAWLLVLDTKGVNLWCAAGKGTFGTQELIRRITETGLEQLVSHRTVILPQLGATGVSAYKVAKATGFRVVYGPVRITDIQEFIQTGNIASEEMRRVHFPFKDRLVLTPIEMIHALKTAIFSLGVLFLLNLFMKNPFGWTDIYAYFGALLAGCVVMPALLPWIPGRAFAWKGFLLGAAWACGLNLLHGGLFMPDYGLIRAIGYLLILPSVSGYYALNFTGSSTYTSLSGVKKEMRTAIPALLAFFGAGALLLLLNGFGIL